MTDTMTYEQALAFIHGARGLGKKAGLDNMRALLTRLGNPERDFNAVHVAGTNGKGSVCAFVHAGLVCAGMRTGLYTSPYLQRYNERIRLDGEPVSDAKLAALTSEVAREVEALRARGVYPTEFEIGTAVAFLFFARHKVDCAVVEVGLGGRLDPTNTLEPRLCAIASIGLDHTAILGDTVEKIAFEKAGIAKRGVPLVLSAQVTGSARRVILERCRKVNAPLVSAGVEMEGTLGLPGEHQRYNAGVARAVLRRLGVHSAAIDEGLRRTRWPARLEWIGRNPPLLLDGAHNPQGAAALASYLSALPCGKTALLCGVLRDKDWPSMVDMLATLCDEAICVSPDNPRALPAEALARAFAERGVAAQCAPNAAEGLHLTLEKAQGGRAVAAGSLYLAGEVRTLLVGTDDALLAPKE